MFFDVLLHSPVAKEQLDSVLGHLAAVYVVSFAVLGLLFDLLAALERRRTRPTLAQTLLELRRSLVLAHLVERRSVRPINRRANSRRVA